jgi:flavin reductase (DIM6/NTAB) family NADH-FMN oxidoreductase RutF
MSKRQLPLSKVYGLLEPGPVLLLTTAHKGHPNVMTLSWQTMLEFEPPQIGCVVSNRNFSFKALKATRQCVLNIPDRSLANEVVGCGNTSGRDIDKFEAFNLSTAAATLVKAPLIEACFANLECRVIDTSRVNRYGLFVLEVVQAWYDPSRKTPDTLHHRGKGHFMVAGETIVLPSKMK